MPIQMIPADQKVQYPNACCNVEGNLVKLEEESKSKLLVQQCKICKCRHRELTVDPGEFQAMVAAGQIPGTGVYQ